MKLFQLLFCLWLGVASAFADVKLPAIFGDHMVLQRDGSVPVWGWAAPNEQVIVTIGQTKLNAIADVDGKWMVRFKDLGASDRPMEMTVAGQSNQITLHDVLLGDVWLCGGESNVAVSLDQIGTAKDEIAQASQPGIRFFLVKPHPSLIPLSDCEGQWMVCSPDSAKRFSAIGYYFAKEIAATEKMPVGVIGVYCGTAPAQAWSRLDTLMADATFKKDYVDQFTEGGPDLSPVSRIHDQWMVAYGNAFQAAMAQWNTANGLARKNKQPPPPRPPPPSVPEPNRPDSTILPSVLNNGMIVPLVPFALKGVVWYQGDGNAGQSDYMTLLPAMITDWRKQWGQGNFPFLYAQMPAHGNLQTDPVDNSSWAKTREAQLSTLAAAPNTAMATMLDLVSDKNGPNKADIAHRLSLVARQLVYSEKLISSGPVIDSWKFDGDKVHVVFKNVGDGLQVESFLPSSSADVSGTTNEIKGFTLSGEGNHFVWAKATFESSNTICVSSDAVAIPTIVRYGWADNLEANLANSAGLPASPFRSDCPVLPPPDATLVAAEDDFFTVDSIQYHGEQHDSDTLLKDVPQTDDQGKLHTTQIFTPYLEARIDVKKDIKSNGLVARAYFYDRNKEPIREVQTPSDVKKGKKTLPAWPVIVPQEEPQSLFFVIPDQVQKESSWSAIVVFGDRKGVTAKLYSSDEFGRLTDYDYPGKTPPQASNDNTVTEVVDRQATVNPIIEHVERTDNPKQPQITLFMRMPLGVTKTDQVKGVLAMSLLAGSVDGVRRQLQGAEAADQLSGPLRFAEEHHLAVVCWGSQGLWDPRKNWDDQPTETTRETDKEFDEVANAWEHGIQNFISEYGIPKNNYLLWGESGSAQYACRLALRKPEYFLAIHAHIPSSFDKPTPDANRVLWCLTTGELEAGHARSLRFYKQCRQMGYPITYKAVVGLGHAWSPISADLGLKFFAYALSIQDQRTAYEASLNDPLARPQVVQAGDGSIEPWPESFRSPAYIGDTVNQEMFPSEQIDMVPASFRTPLPTKDIADAWNK